MTGPDEEFEDFLKRRKPVFRAPADMFEPPAELDRVVLRQAREAIESEQPLRVFRGPRWAAPIALAATLVLAVGVVFQAGMPVKRQASAEVTVENVAQRIEAPQAAVPAPAESTNNSRADVAASGAASDTTSNTMIVDLAQPTQASGNRALASQDAGAPAPAVEGGFVSRDEAEGYAAPPPPAAPVARSAAERSAPERSVAGAMDAPPLVVTVPAAKATENPAWRRDPKTWLAEIERLRNAGDNARATAELEEFKRQHRAYAVAPDQ